MRTWPHRALYRSYRLGGPAGFARSGREPIDALWVVLAYLAIRQVETYLVMQKTVSLHPAVAAVTLLGAAFVLLSALLTPGGRGGGDSNAGALV